MAFRRGAPDGSVLVGAAGVLQPAAAGLAEVDGVATSQGMHPGSIVNYFCHLSSQGKPGSFGNHFVRFCELRDDVGEGRVDAAVDTDENGAVAGKEATDHGGDAGRHTETSRGYGGEFSFCVGGREVFEPE